ncbi:uncharacterized protein B0T23DRAFT_434959 [Neurospora hispaniola]
MFFTKPRLRRIIGHNLHHFLSPHLLLSEISGSLGDLGTLLPLLLALSLQGSIDLPSTLIFSGLFNILTGLVFGVPLPVQPMKAIAAASLQGNADLETTVAAGAWVGLAVLLLGGTGGLKRVMRWVPGAVVRGVQVGAGMSLVVAAGGGMIRPLGWLWTPEENGHGGLGEWLDSRALAVVAFGGLVVTLGQQQQQQQQSGEKERRRRRRRKRSRIPVQVPYALVLFLLGIVFAVVRVSLSKDSPQSPPPPPYDQPTNSAPWTWIWNPLNHIHPEVFRSLLNPQALSMAIAQLPLTTLNSIIAASALASDLFPPDSYPQLYDDESSDPPLSPSPSASSSLSSVPPQTPSENPKPLSSPTSEEGPVPLTPLSLSISAMNLLSAPFGCMPLCHGSGGLAAQHRFGARSGTSIILLGLTKFLLGLFFPGPGLLGLLGKFPKAFLGVMVLGAGVELARVGVRNVEGEEQDRMVMLMTAGTILAFKNDGVGFLAGMGCYGGFRGRGGEQGLLGEEEEEEQGRVDEESPLLR